MGISTRIALSALLLSCAAQAEQATLELIMSDPDWIGNEPQQSYWSDDGSNVYYLQKRIGEDILDYYRIALSGGEAQVLNPAQLNADSGPGRIYNPQRSAAAWLHGGDVWLKTLPDGEAVAVTQTVAKESTLQFSAGGNGLYFLRDQQFYRYELPSGRTRQITHILTEKDPDDAEEFDPLNEQQQRNYNTVVEDKRRADAVTAQKIEFDRQLATIYLGDTYKIVDRQLSPNGRHLALVVTSAEAEEDDNAASIMPNYVTADGTVSSRKVRKRVGRGAPEPQQVLLLDIETQQLRTLNFQKLSAMHTDPLKQLRRDALRWYIKSGVERQLAESALRAPEKRGLLVRSLKWNHRGDTLALQLESSDYKDRWLTSVSPETGDVRQQHHLHDDAWINWDHNEFGWLADGRSLWFLSEQSGYSHLYTKGLDDLRSKALTEGEFVVAAPTIDPQNNYAYFVANRNHPGNHQVFRVALEGGDIEQVSTLDGVGSFVLSADGTQLLLSHSSFARHPELYVAKAEVNAKARQITSTISERYSAIDWNIPQIVEVPSSHVKRPIYSKLYLPPDYDSAKSYPAVMFVHGAGYTQNAHMGWPYYFREFMFHTVLSNAGFVVLDMDYRASKGYGRDWRTSIYRNMGHPELEDYLDGIAYLTANHKVNPKRVGIYGGSYGGFMTFMALFRAPDAFAAGAALRPVVDWMHYEHEYTARILNTPDVDPEAYQRSSPINHAEGLTKPLLIASGMQDDNVFFQDSVLLVQRLIELKKENFELAVYPLDGHGFTHPDSWLDEYRRVFKLMKEQL